MGQSAIDAVLAGTKSFAVALLAPLTARIGNRPRLAADPSQVLGLCSGPSALAVVEFTGEGSLGTIQALVRDGKGLRVVAGVPTAHAGAEGTLLALGVEVGRWDGKIDGVVLAVERAVTAMASAPSSPALPRSAAAAPKAAAPGAPAAAPRPAPAAAAPRPSSPVAAPATPRPAMVPPGRAVPPGSATAAAPMAPRAPAAAAKPASAPSAAAPPRPAAAPTAPAASPAAPGASASVAGPAPQRTGPPQAPPRAAPPADPPPPTLSRQPVVVPPAAKPASASVAQPLAAQPRQGGAAQPPIARPAPAPAPAPAARPPASFFDDMEGDDISIDEELPQPKPVDLHAPGIYVPPPPAARVDWPAGICSDAEAGDALRRALDGKTDAQPLDALAAAVIEAASDLERAVLKGEPQPFEVTPVRKAAAIRLRVAEALATVPAPGSTVDATALSAVLGQIDGLLAEVAPLLQGAPEELVPALEAVRNSLVSEAIDFSEAAQRVAAVEPAHLPTLPAPATRGVRVLSVGAEDVEVPAGRGKRIALVVVTVLVGLAVGTYHLRRLMPRPAQPLKSPAGLPVGVTGYAKDGIQILNSIPGRSVDAAEMERFKAVQEAKGNTVQEVGTGVWIVKPRSAKGATP